MKVKIFFGKGKIGKLFDEVFEILGK